MTVQRRLKLSLKYRKHIIGQLDKKRKAFLGILQQAAKLISNPKSPEFLEREVKKARKLWDDTNKLALDQLDKLTQNQEAWESYEEERNDVSETLVAGETEFANIKKINVMCHLESKTTETDWLLPKKLEKP